MRNKLNRKGGFKTRPLQIAHILLILFIGAIGVQTFTSCSSDTTGGGGGGGNPARAGTYSGTADGSTYSLEIFANNNFEFTWTGSGNSTKTSTGTVVSVSGNVFTMLPSNAATPRTTFTTTVSDEGLTAMSGTFTWEDGTTTTKSGALTPSGGPGPVTLPNNGGTGGIATNGQLTINGIPAEYNGKYAYALGYNGSLWFDAGQTLDDGFVTAARIANGSVTLKVWRTNLMGTTYNDYSGNDKGVSFSVYISNSIEAWTDDEEEIGVVTVDFSGGKATGTLEEHWYH